MFLAENSSSGCSKTLLRYEGELEKTHRRTRRCENQRILIPVAIAALHGWLLMWGDWRAFRMFDKKDGNSINSNQFSVSLYTNMCSHQYKSEKQSQAMQWTKSGDKRHIKKQNLHKWQKDSLTSCPCIKVKWCKIVTMDGQKGQTTGNLFNSLNFTRTTKYIYTLRCPLHTLKNNLSGRNMRRCVNHHVASQISFIHESKTAPELVWALTSSWINSAKVTGLQVQYLH